MTISPSESWSLPLSSQSVATSVRISPTRRRLDRQSPTLAFTISTTKPFVEVVLTTRPELFEPARAGERTPATFFASRAFGLLATQSGEATYFVPAAALHALLAGGSVRQLYFTAVAYDDAEGRGATPAAPPAQLASSAPSVQVEAGFGAANISRAFGTSLERLLRPESPAYAASIDAGPAWSPPPAESATASPPARWTGTGRIQIPTIRVEADAQEVDGFALSEPDLDGFDRDDDGYAGSQEAEEVDAYRSYDHDLDHVHREGYDQDHDHGASGAEAAAYGHHEPARAAADVEYDDGFGDDAEAATEASLAGAEPAELIDEESAYGDESEEPHASGQSAAAPDLQTPALPPPGDQRAIFEEVAKGVDGGPSLYEVARPTPEGLSFGVGAFTQASGLLGRLLQMMRARDAAELARVFTPHVDALVATLTAPTREARLAPVAGAPLTDPSWLSRFSRAGDREHAGFRGAQNELLSSAVFEPLWPIARGLGLTSDRALAVVTALGIHQGPAAAADWLVARVGPAQAGPHIQRALAAVGATDLAAFQARAGLPATSTLDARTHAALTFALRALGDRSPVTVLAPRQMLEAIARHVGPGGIGRKIAELLATPALSERTR